MDIRRILVPTDFSAHSVAALQLATTLARQADAMLLILHVSEPPPIVSNTQISDMLEDDWEQQKRLAAARPSDPEVGYKQKMVAGRPAAEILRAAEEEQADLIVMGTHGRRGLSRLLMGSVAEEVVRDAACPVLTLRQPVPATAAQ